MTRYPVAASVNPRENRLTEATAAVLDQVAGLPGAFVSCLLDAGIADARAREFSEGELARREALRASFGALISPRVDIATQVATSGGRFVDLELLVRPRLGVAGKGLLLWVEVKHRASLHGDQLDAYLKQIGTRPVAGEVERVVVLLAPRGWVPPEAGAVPTSVLRADWPDVGAAVGAAGGAATAGVATTAGAGKAAAPGAEQRWLLHEYIRYLKEENLSDPDALTTVTALTLMEYRTARDAAAGLCEHADAVLMAADGWGPRHDHQQTRGKNPVPAHGLDYWATYDAHRKGQAVNPNWRGGWFEWGLRDTTKMDSLEGARGTWAFSAGVTFDADSPLKVAGNEAWIARMTAAGFVRFWEAGYWRLARLRYPDEVLSDTTLEGQGRAVGRWVAESFGVLADDPPEA